MDELVSIIVPVYNTGEYLAPCVESLIAQTYQNIEIILVNDGSTDGSGVVCDDFACRDERVKVIHQKNSGVSAARNAGLKAALGDYLTFVDSDDLLVPSALETAMRYLRENDADMVTYGWKKLRSNASENEEVSAPFEVCTDIPAVIREILENYSAYGGGYPWNKLWRRDSRICEFAPDLYYFEDLEWVIRMLLRIHKFAVCPECLYCYRIHAGSVSQDPAKMERRELGYHHSIERIIDDLAFLPDLQSWFSRKYAPEIVNGIIYAVKNRQIKLRVYLSRRLSVVKDMLIRSDSVNAKIKLRCRVLCLLGLDH